jgi:methionine sulfoxide reductase catalytic subunit
MKSAIGQLLIRQRDNTLTKLIPTSQITPEALYLSRRRFLKQALLTTSASILAASCANRDSASPTPNPDFASFASLTDDQNNPLTAYEDITGYTNFYEFSTSKTEPTNLSKNFQTEPWKVKIDGLVNNPITLDLDDFRSMFDQEERIYRMRCVEAWSMVIPWLGFPLKKILDIVEPSSDAKYVRFETLYDPSQMPGQNNPSFPWPYVEGLRLDEAMHDLSILSTGLYGKDLTPQNGAPIRLVVPWKYGFKSIKSIVHIELVREMPTSLWMASGPTEYGFFANVNPNVDHPRWSQATERRIGDTGRIDTQLFNGYEEEVAYLYEGMDLTINY